MGVDQAVPGYTDIPHVHLQLHFEPQISFLVYSVRMILLDYDRIYKDIPVLFIMNHFYLLIDVLIKCVTKGLASMTKGLASGRHDVGLWCWWKTEEERERGQPHWQNRGL